MSCMYNSYKHAKKKRDTHCCSEVAYMFISLKKYLVSESYMRKQDSWIKNIM